MTGDHGSDNETVSDQENDDEASNETLRRSVVVMQVDVRNDDNIETLLVDLKRHIERRRIQVTESSAETPSVNIPIKFKLKTWEWVSTSPYLNYRKYHPNDDSKLTTTHHLIACYYRMGPTGRAEVFLASNTKLTLMRFRKFANTEFPLQITKRLVDCDTIAKDSSHHLIGNVFTNTRTLRNTTKIDFNDIPILLLAFTASLRKHASIFKLSPFDLPSRDHRVNVATYSVGFTTPLSRDEEIIALDHLCTIIRGERTYLTSGDVEDDIDLPLDITEVNKDVGIRLNHQMAHSIYRNVILKEKLDLTLHFSAESFVASSEITFASQTLLRTEGIPTVAEILEVISTSEKFNKKKAPKPEELWNIVRKFRIHLRGYDDQVKCRSKSARTPLVVDAMHGAIHYKGNTYWRVCSKWYLVSSDRLAVVQHKFRQLLQNHLMSELDPAYLSKKFLMSTPIDNESMSPCDSQASTSTAAITQDTQRSETLSQQRDYLENAYNCSYATEPDFLVGDKITANNIEIFDLLRYDRDNGKMWIYHVKRKFGQCTRDAASQLSISAKLIYDDIVGSGEKTLKKLYDKLAENTEMNEKLLEWGIRGRDDYEDLFRSNKLIFVYAFVDEDNKSSKRTLKDESQMKGSIEIADLVDKLELYKRQINDNTNFKSLIHELYRLVFHLDSTESDTEDLVNVAKNLFDFLVAAKLIELNGKVTGKLLFGINFNQLGDINPTVLKFQEFSLRLYTKINFFEFILKPYRSLYQTLIAKIELQRLQQCVLERGFEFQICELQRVNTNDIRPAMPQTPLIKTAIKRKCGSGSNSSEKRPKTSRSSSKKKEIPRGQRLISESFPKRVVSRKLNLD